MLSVSTMPYEFQVMRNRLNCLHESNDLNILIYWPHGFGDFVFLGYALPLINPRNRYFICRIGDDNSSVFEGSEYVTPLYSGYNSVHLPSESQASIPHLGLRAENDEVSVKKLHLPAALATECERKNIRHILDPHFPEIYGHASFPFHSKARHLLHALVANEETLTPALNSPLSNAISFSVAESVMRWVEARLNTCGGLRGRKLCVIGRNGYTSVGKNWGHRWREDMPEGEQVEGQECRDFMRLMLAKNPSWLFLTCEDRLASGFNSVRDPQLNCVSYAELFGSRNEVALPYGWILRALMNLAELVVGVPSGPYHLAMVKKGLPVAGIWIEHFPSWYDEPKIESRHLISRNITDTGSDKRPGTLSEVFQLNFRTRWLQTRIVPGQVVFEAVGELLGFTV